MALQIEKCQRQRVVLTLTRKELIDLALKDVDSIGNWRIISQAVTAIEGKDYNHKHIEISAAGNVSIVITLEAPVIG